MVRQWRFFFCAPEGKTFSNISPPEHSPITRRLYNFACCRLFSPEKMSKWLQFNKTVLEIRLIFTLMIMETSSSTSLSANVLVELRLLYLQTFFLQVWLASVCSHDCTSTDMFPLLCRSGHKFKTSYGSGAAFPWGKWALSPVELYPSPSLIPFPGLWCHRHPACECSSPWRNPPLVREN